MCHPDGSLPPLPPVSGGAQDYGDLTLTSADGTELGAYRARSDQPTTRGMVVLPDVRGLHRFYKDLAIRFADAGMHSVAIDYFGRTAGIGERDEAFEFMPHVQQTRPETLAADVAAGAAYLRSPEGGSCTSVFCVGFCFGGATAWAQSADNPDLAGCIGFYGMPSRVRDRIPDMRAPLLLLIAGQDFTPLPEFEQFDKDLSEAGVDHEMHVYPNATHSFFDRAFEQFKDECDDAWRRILAFVDTHAG